MIDVRPDSKRNKFRRGRINLLQDLIAKTLEKKSNCSVLDVGGTYNFWHVWRDEIAWDRTQITCVNHNPSHLDEGKRETKVRMLKGNACNLSDIADYTFDVAFSNSVIEHVGSWRNMKAMATEVKRVAPQYLVQTPNFWFPIEPHARTPFLLGFQNP